MSAKRVRCPNCSAVLGMPQNYKGTKFLCGKCEARFRIPTLSDAEILDLIGPRSRDDTAIGMTAVAVAPPKTAMAVGAQLQLSQPSSDVAMAGAHDGKISAGREGFSLVRVTSQGALFEFPAKFLQESAFRAGMPRRCLRCGIKQNLKPHVIIFSHQMTENAAAEGEYLNKSQSLNEDEKDLYRLSDEDILQRLPRVKRVPAPADNPMPYWICDMCSPSNMVFAANEINPQTHQGHCHIRITRLWRAEEFLINVGRENSPAHRQIRKLLLEHQETPWDMLHGVVQQRIGQWYKPHKGERFVAYMPDRTHCRTEDGMAGVVVSNRRMIYHCSMQHRESEKGEPLELDFAIREDRLRLHIKTPNWNIKNMLVDKPGLRILRHALTKENFQALWR